MKRLAVGALAALGLLALPAVAGAKELKSVEACGASGCKTTTDHRTLLAFMRGGGVSGGGSLSSTPAPAPFYSLKITAPGGEARDFSWKVFYVPRAHMIRVKDEANVTSWLPVSARVAFAEITRGVKPFPVPAISEARIGSKSADDPASYVRLYTVKSTGETLPDASDWTSITLWSKPSSPWGDGANSLSYSPSKGLMMRDGEPVVLPRGMAGRMERGASLDPGGSGFPWLPLVAALAATAAAAAAAAHGWRRWRGGPQPKPTTA